jgi:hypothetical protein
MRNSFERRKEADARQAQIAAQTDALKRWLEKSHLEIPFNTAVLEAFQEDMGDAFLTATDEDFEYSLSTTRTTFSRRRVPTEAEQVANENARRRSLSVSELQQLARQEHPVPQPDALPEFYLPIGKKKAVQLTADVIRRAGTRTGEISTADLKFLIRRYGSSEVNKRLGVKPTIQPGYSKPMSI